MPDPTVATCLWFEKDAEKAAEYYVSLFPDAKITSTTPQIGQDGKPVGVLIVEFELRGQRYQGLNGGPHYKLSPAASISVLVETQDELDHYWDHLLADGGSEMQCGWLEDRWGLSWQIVPRALMRLTAQDDRAAAARVVQAMMGMVKIDIAALEAASRS